MNIVFSTKEIKSQVFSNREIVNSASGTYMQLIRKLRIPIVTVVAKAMRKHG